MELYDTSEGFLYLNTAFPQVINNILNDNTLTDQLKQEFFDFVSTITDTSDLESVINSSFFYLQQFQLVSTDVVDNNFYGHCLGKIPFILSLKRLDFTLEDDVIETFLDSCDVDELKQAYGTFSIRDRGIMWSFYNIDESRVLPTSIFPYDDLPCLLGLSNPAPTVRKEIQYFALGHEVDKKKIAVKKPTAFDAGLNELWRPGGFTLPLANCKTKLAGLPEAVHPPNQINDIHFIVSFNYTFI